MFDAKKLLDQFLGGAKDQNTGGMSGDFMKGAGVAGLATVLLSSKTGRKLAGSAVKYGGAAVLGGLAYSAFKNWQAGKAAEGQADPQPMKDVTPTPETAKALQAPATEQASLAILRAMIAAAKSDGHIDAAEQKAIFDKLDALNLDTEAKAFVIDELRKPLDVSAVIAAATSPELAIEIYTASVLAIDPDDPKELAYLAQLASGLKLDPGLKAAIETEARKALA
jgi:uncharacterized membrane protein YebE (DUF533 family)